MVQLWPSLDSPEMKTRAAASHANNMPSVPYPCQIMLHLAFPVSAQIICHAEVSGLQSLSRGYDGAVKIGATQIKLDNRILGDRWTEVLEEIISCRSD